MKLKETLIKSNKVYSGKSLNFLVDTIRLPNGNTSVREYNEHPGAVTVLPFLDKKRIVFVKQYRHPVREITYELPAGKLEKGENLLNCARRELVEETGFKAAKVNKLISYWPTPAFSTEIIHIYFATGLTPVKSSPDEDEFIDKLILSFDEALTLIEKGKIKDSKSIIALLFWFYKKGR